MKEFTVFVERLIKVLASINKLVDQKNKFAKSINYQVGKLHKAIEQKYQNNAIFVQNLQKALFVSQNNVNITPQTLCQYLSVSLFHLNRSYSIFSIKEKDVRNFLQIIAQDIKIRKLLKALFNPCEQMVQQRLSELFEQIDFFGNGYITIQSLKQFTNHYNKNSILNIDGLELFVVMQIISNSGVSQKIYFEDLMAFVKQQQMNQADFIENRLIDPSRIQQQSKLDYNTINKVTLSKQAKIRRISEDQQLESHKQRSERLTTAKRQIQTSTVSIQSKLIASHSRNQRYLQLINKPNLSTSASYLHKNDRKLLVQRLNSSEKTYKAEINIQIKAIINNFNQRKKEVRSFIQNNPKFTFFDGFSLIDPQQHMLVIEDDFLAFLNDHKIKYQHTKACLFFKKYSKANVMEYSTFLKIFKVRSLQRLYQSCKNRSPLIVQSMPIQSVNNFSSFISTIIKLTSQQEKLKDQFKVIVQKQSGQLFKGYNQLKEFENQEQNLISVFLKQEGILAEFNNIMSKRDLQTNFKEKILNLVMKI